MISEKLKLIIFKKKAINTYKGIIYKRCDDTGTVFFFSADDFPGLKTETLSFKASAGHTLEGCFYEYENAIPGRLIVFDHGFGGGHLAYMKEIEKLCRHGYKVFSYDHTGCMKSGGETPNGLGQSLCDLNDCITMLKNDERFKNYDISVMGHSWGGFSTLNISALHPEISHIVALSGFVSVQEMVNMLFPDKISCFRNLIFNLEKESNPESVKYHAVETLKNSDTKALLIYSDNDTRCKRIHYDILKEGLAEKQNVKFLLVQNKNHNPNYTEDAVNYLREFSSARAKFIHKKNITDEEKAEFVASFDWDRMTAQDESVWNEIFNHLDN